MRATDANTRVCVMSCFANVVSCHASLPEVVFIVTLRRAAPSLCRASAGADVAGASGEEAGDPPPPPSAGQQGDAGDGVSWLVWWCVESAMRDIGDAAGSGVTGGVTGGTAGGVTGGTAAGVTGGTAGGVTGGAPGGAPLVQLPLPERLAALQLLATLAKAYFPCVR